MVVNQVSLKDLAPCPTASNNSKILLPVEATETIAIYSLMNNLPSHLVVDVLEDSIPTSHTQ